MKAAKPKVLKEKKKRSIVYEEEKKQYSPYLALERSRVGFHLSGFDLRADVREIDF